MEYRFKLEKYKGMKSRFQCPECGKENVFARYICTVDNKRLPLEYGRCNRELKCGYHKNPYTAGYKAGQHFDHLAGTYNVTSRTAKKQRRKLVTLPIEVFKKSLGRYAHNSFANFLVKQFGQAIAIQLIKRFYLGTGFNNSDAVIFWLINSNMKFAGGQVVSFDKNGNTKKSIRDGKTKRHINWIHYDLKSKLKSLGKPIPEYLEQYISNSPKSPCLFGLPQLKIEDQSKPIAIVEAPKTAVIATAYMPQYIWMAVGSLSQLTFERLEPLLEKEIVLFPDKGCFEKWACKSKEFSKIFKIKVSDYLEHIEMVKEGEDIADYLLTQVMNNDN